MKYKQIKPTKKYSVLRIISYYDVDNATYIWFELEKETNSEVIRERLWKEYHKYKRTYVQIYQYGGKFIAFDNATGIELGKIQFTEDCKYYYFIPQKLKDITPKNLLKKIEMLIN